MGVGLGCAGPYATHPERLPEASLGAGSAARHGSSAVRL